jgi:DHA1 family tetracycline resistance protein-like MFS transporter
MVRIMNRLRLSPVFLMLAFSVGVASSSTSPATALVLKEKVGEVHLDVKSTRTRSAVNIRKRMNGSKRKKNISSGKNAVAHRGGAVAAPPPSPPSMYWAVLHNWLYFLSLGFNLINVPFMIRIIVDGEGAKTPSREAISLSGKVESVDKLLTFAGVGFLSALSDRYGRRPLMAWSAFGFMITNLIQANARTSVAALYFADFVDGCSSCMLPLCQAYVADCSLPSNLATNLGIFQGISAAGAFIFAFPIGGLLGAKYGPRLPLLIAAAMQAINAAIIIFVTPESNPSNHNKKIDLREASPIGGLVRLFGRSHLLRITSTVYLLASLARSSLDAQFPNYTNLRFGWTQAQSGPVLVLVGLMLAVGPRILVPRLGLRNSILSGLLIFAMGLTGSGLSPTPGGFVASIGVVAIGCVCLPALQALLANLAPPGERGALLGAVGSLNELTGGIGSTLYASILALFTSDIAPLPIPGMHFLLAASLLLVAWGIALPGFLAHKDDKVFERR